MLKSELRKTYLPRQRHLSHTEHVEKSRQIADRFFQSFDLKKFKFFHGFLPIEKNREIDTWLIFQRLWRDYPHLETFVSRVDFDRMTLENVALSPDTKLVFNRWHILEPAELHETVESRKIDVALIPLLAFDRQGYRVGYGKGFYDKLLSDCRPDMLKIGLSYFPPVEKISDVWELDVKLDCCVTPDELIDLRN